MYFGGPYLRVLTPKTTDGMIPLIVDGEQQWNETFAPLSARKQLEKKNDRLAKSGYNHLRAIIEVVGAEESVEVVKSASQKVRPKKDSEITRK